MQCWEQVIKGSKRKLGNRNRQGRTLFEDWTNRQLFKFRITNANQRIDKKFLHVHSVYVTFYFIRLRKSRENIHRWQRKAYWDENSQTDESDWRYSLCQILIQSHNSCSNRPSVAKQWLRKYRCFGRLIIAAGQHTAGLSNSGTFSQSGATWTEILHDSQNVSQTTWLGVAWPDKSQNMLNRIFI